MKDIYHLKIYGILDAEGYKKQDVTNGSRFELEGFRTIVISCRKLLKVRYSVKEDERPMKPYFEDIKHHMQIGKYSD